MNRRVTRRGFLKQASSLAAAASSTILSDAWISHAGPQLPSAPHPLVLWYEQPASQWVQALPVGNGRLGAMVFGGVTTERLQLNEDTLHAGGPYDANNPEALAALPEARRLILDGRYKEASALIGARMMSKPLKQMPYEPVGNLELEFAGPRSSSRDYRRELDLETAVARVATVGDAQFTREVFASPVDQVIVVQLACDKPGQITLPPGLHPQQATVTAEARHAGDERPERRRCGHRGRLEVPGARAGRARGGGTERRGWARRRCGRRLGAVADGGGHQLRSYKDVSGDPRRH